MDGDASFLPGVARWVAGLGRLRDVVRQELVAVQLHEELEAFNRPLRVLDVGCGQGTQSIRLARQGHDVTGLDLSAELLDRFEADLAHERPAVRRRVELIRGPGEAAAELTSGRFDVLICHGVLMYLDDLAPMLTALTAVAADGAVLSLLVRNGYAPAMRDGLRGNWPAALEAFDRRDYVNRLGLPARAHTPEDLDALLVPRGWAPRRWFGVRVFTDHRDEAAPPAELVGAIVSAEAEAGRREPYRRVAALLHMLYGRR